MVKFNDFVAEYKAIQQEIDAAIARVLERGWFILGPEVEAFEAAFAALTGVAYCVGVASGTDAITLALRALGVGSGDEVITTSMTAYPTITGIVNAGALPVVVDINPDDGLIRPDAISQAITSKTKAIVPVHLYGQSCDMDAIKQIAEDNGLFIVEDCAQAFGARYKGIPVGGMGDCGAFSFYPTKNLGAYGDAGAVVTSDEEIYNRLRSLRNYGQTSRYHHDDHGINSRLDELQAAVLQVKLGYVKRWNARRNEIARYYREHLKGVRVLDQHAYHEHVYHLFVVKSGQRDQLMEHLRHCGVQTLIHYPLPVFSQKAFTGRLACVEPQNVVEFADSILSLPVHPWLQAEEIEQVVACVNGFYE